MSKTLLSGAALLAALAVVPAHANLVITPIYGSDITAAAQAEINKAIAFYTDNFTGSASVVVGFGIQPGGGASASQFVYAASYASYLNKLQGNKTESATDVAALASLPAQAPVGNGTVQFTSALSAQLGFGTPSPRVWTGSFCGGQTINGCIAYNQSYLTGGADGGPAAGLFGVTQHEINEILGSSSNLSDNAAPAGTNNVPNTSTVTNAADLFRFSASGVRSFSTNPGSAGGDCPAGTPGAYLSVDGGVTNLTFYNNCANGGDYGDFAVTELRKPQDYASQSSSASALSLESPEVKLLDAIGFNIQGNPTVAVGTVAPISTTIVSTGVQAEGGDDDGDFHEATAVPEPASIAILAIGLASMGAVRRRAKV